MERTKLTVVVSQSSADDPSRRQLEADLVAELMKESRVDVSLIPHLYDLTADHAGMIFLQSLAGDIVILSWMYPRATRWVLFRHGIKGQIGETPLSKEGDRSSKIDHSAVHAGTANDTSDRVVYCIDLREHATSVTYAEEVRRIAQERILHVVDVPGESRDDTSNAERPVSQTRSGQTTCDGLPWDGTMLTTGCEDGLRRIQEAGAPDGRDGLRRWYPVIDYDRCTNCLECIDFCLFGVFGIDEHDRILVEQEDNCKQGCPACSRVCPESAIIFPAHKSPAIAGEDGEIGSLKIDLSSLFGASSALEIAMQERNSELIKDGHDALNANAASQADTPCTLPQNPDELDDLIDRLNNMPL